MADLQPPEKSLGNTLRKLAKARQSKEKLAGALAAKQALLEEAQACASADSAHILYTRVPHTEYNMCHDCEGHHCRNACLQDNIKCPLS